MTALWWTVIGLGVWCGLSALVAVPLVLRYHVSEMRRRRRARRRLGWYT